VPWEYFLFKPLLWVVWGLIIHLGVHSIHSFLIHFGFSTFQHSFFVIYVLGMRWKQMVRGTDPLLDGCKELLIIP
jgi:hypothetical protein